MKTQAWAWLTAGVVALGLNGFYHDGGAGWAHQVAAGISDRADSVIERVSGRAEQLVAEARMAADREVIDRGAMDRGEIAREEATSCPFSKARSRVRARIARTQTAVAHFDAMSAREQAQMDRWQTVQDRIQARVQSEIDRQTARMRVTRTGTDPVEIRVACPRVQVNVPAVRIPEVRIPAISIPRVNIPQIPAFRITAPVISGDESDSGPI